MSEEEVKAVEVKAEEKPAEAIALKPINHHPHGMSKWPAILACPCFESKPPTAATNAGTDTHEFLAYVLNYVKSHLGEFPTFNEPLNAFQNGALKAAKFLVEKFTASKGKWIFLQIESKCELPDGVFGTCDAAWKSEEEKRIYVFDFKTFYNPSRDYSAQLMGYALALDTKHHWPVSLMVAYGMNPEANGTVDASYKEIKRNYTLVKKAFKRAESGVARAKHCAFCELCSKQETCGAMLKTVTAIEKKKPIAAAEVVDAMTTETLARWVYLADTLKDWATKFRDLAKARMIAQNLQVLNDDKTGTRFELRKSNGRKTPRVTDAWAACKARNIGSDEFMAGLSISAMGLTKLLKAHGESGKDAEAIVDSVSDVGQGSVSLVRA